MLNIKIPLLTIAAAILLLIPGASAAPDEPLIGDGEGVASGDASGLKESVRCVAQINPVIGVPITDQVAQCSAEAVSGVGDFVICMGNWNLPANIVGEIVNHVERCLAVLYSNVPDAGTLELLE